MFWSSSGKEGPKSVIWVHPNCSPGLSPGPEVAQLPPKNELTSPEAGQSKTRFSFYFSDSSLDTNTKFLSNITFPWRAQAFIEEIMMSSQKLKSINLKVKNPILFCITNADELFKSAQKL